MKTPLFAISIGVLTSLLTQTVHAECYGEADYRVCSETYSDADGDMHVRSWDTEGNTYSVHTESETDANGTTVRSYDSEGNEYEMRSWSDSTGTHSVDSEGNRCTITNSGTIIGCE